MAPCSIRWGRSPSLLDVLQTSGFPLQIAQVVELGPPHFRRAHDVDLVHNFGVDREDTLDALTETHFSYGEAGLRTVALRDHDTFERLQAFLFAFLDLHLHPDGIARSEAGDICAFVLGKKLFNDWVRHIFLPLGCHSEATKATRNLQFFKPLRIPR